MKAEILTIGDELLRGEIVDSNKSFLSERLLLARRRDALPRRRCATTRADMTDAFLRAREPRGRRARLGRPRPDARRPHDRGARADVRPRARARTSRRSRRSARFFARFGREMAREQREAGVVPGGRRGARRTRSAPRRAACSRCPRRKGRARSRSSACPACRASSMRMMDEQVLPRIAARRAAAGRPARVVRAALLRTFGLGESNLDAGAARRRARRATSMLGFRTAFPDNYLRPVARAATRGGGRGAARRGRATRSASGSARSSTARATRRWSRWSGALLARARAHARDGRVLHRRAGRREQLTAVPGSSRYFLGGVVGLRERRRSARCSACPAALLDRARRGVGARWRARWPRARGARFGADLAVATTGISGPDGGTPQKPVGLVYVGVRERRGQRRARAPLPARPRAPPPAHGAGRARLACAATCSASSRWPTRCELRSDEAPTRSALRAPDERDPSVLRASRSGRTRARAAAVAARRLARERARRARCAGRAPRRYHVTLRFLGEIAAEQAAPLAARVAETRRRARAVRARGSARSRAFPSPRRPRVVAVDARARGAARGARARASRPRWSARACPAEERALPRRTSRSAACATARIPALGCGRGRSQPQPFRVAEVVLFRERSRARRRRATPRSSASRSA